MSGCPFAVEMGSEPCDAFAMKTSCEPLTVTVDPENVIDDLASVICADLTAFCATSNASWTWSVSSCRLATPRVFARVQEHTVHQLLRALEKLQALEQVAHYHAWRILY